VSITHNGMLQCRGITSDMTPVELTPGGSGVARDILRLSLEPQLFPNVTSMISGAEGLGSNPFSLLVGEPGSLFVFSVDSPSSYSVWSLDRVSVLFLARPSSHLGQLSLFVAVNFGGCGFFWSRACFLTLTLEFLCS
jgi:hypothetical protein